MRNGALQTLHTILWGIARRLTLRTAILTSIRVGVVALSIITLSAQNSILNPFTGRFDFIAPPGRAWGALLATRCLRTDAAGNFVSAGADCAAGAPAYDTVQDEGAPLAQENILNIIGAMVTCVDNPAVSTDCTWANPQAYDTVQDEGAPLAQEADLNFIGAGVTCVDNAGVSTDCTIPGGGAGSGYAIQAIGGSHNPVDSVTRYYGFAGYAPSGSGGYCRLYIPRAGNIISAYVSVKVAGTLSTAETSTFSLRLNNNPATDTVLSNVVQHNAAYQSFITLGLAIAVIAGDYLEIKMDFPAWVTNPSSVFDSAIIYIQ